jgi:eukaryotic-like serine/threonine-protein kinase
MSERPPPPPPAPPITTEPVLGRRVGGRYCLLGEVGRGGMATVYRARDEVLDRDVAVKVPIEALAADRAFRERFRREAQAAAALSHPNVVAVHDWGESADGAFLVLQYVDGPSLRAVLQRYGQLSPRYALAVLGPAAAGLAAAHEAGLIHRDVKPENLLLGRDGTVRVTDFGLARAAASATTTFGPGVLVGSPHYLSPEAVRLERLDARCDVYALGVVLYECLTGLPPHEAESVWATALAHTLQAVPPPSEALPGLDPALDDVVRGATERDPQRRTPDAVAFARELAAAVPGGPAPLRPLVAALGDSQPDERDGPPPPPTPRRVGAAPPATRHDADVASGDAGEAHPPRPAPAPRHQATQLLPETRPELVRTTTVDRPSGPGHVPARPAARSDAGRGAAEAPIRSRRPRRTNGWVVTAVLLALLMAAAAGGYLLWDRVLAPIAPVPSVLGAAAQLATDELLAAGFDVRVVEDRPHDLDVPAGHVLAQRPDGLARTGSAIELVLSAGPRQVEVPGVVGLPQPQAVQVLEQFGFRVDVTEAYDDTRPSGTVLAVDPAAGTVRDEASTVAVTISLGPEPIEVPAVVDATVAEAAAVAEQRGLELVVVERRHDDEVPADVVLDQTPDRDAGTLVRGDTIEVVVSDGPAPIEVPAVRGQRVEEAVATLEAAGFVVEVERRGGFAAFLQPGRVYDQDPAGGSRRARGSTVVLYAYES